MTTELTGAARVRAENGTLILQVEVQPAFEDAYYRDATLEDLEFIDITTQKIEPRKTQNGQVVQF